MDGLTNALTSLLDQLWALLHSGTFWAAAGVIATLGIGGLSIWLEEKSRRARHNARTPAAADDGTAMSPFLSDIRARADGKFLDILDPNDISPSYRWYTGHFADEFERWFDDHRAHTDQDSNPPRMTTHQAFLHWWSTVRADNSQANDFRTFVLTGAFLEQRGYAVGPPISIEEFRNLRNIGESGRFEGSGGETDEQVLAVIRTIMHQQRRRRSMEDSALGDEQTP
jgi:hypothetical protein